MTTGHKTPNRRIPQDTEVVELVVALFRHATTLAAGLADVAGLAPTDATALRALDRIGPTELAVGVLGRDLRLSSAATTGLVDRLERAGLAERRPDPADRRRVMVALTPRALTFGADHLRPILERTTRAAQALPPTHRAAVRDFLAAVLGDEHRTAPTDPTSSP